MPPQVQSLLQRLLRSDKIRGWDPEGSVRLEPTGSTPPRLDIVILMITTG